MRVLFFFVLLAAALATVTGCGQKGPLYLPGDPSQIRTEIPELPEAPGSESDDAAAEPGEEPDPDAVPE